MLRSLDKKLLGRRARKLGYIHIAFSSGVIEIAEFVFKNDAWHIEESHFQNMDLSESENGWQFSEQFVQKILHKKENVPLSISLGQGLSNRYFIPIHTIPKNKNEMVGFLAWRFKSYFGRSLGDYYFTELTDNAKTGSQMSIIEINNQGIQYIDIVKRYSHAVVDLGLDVDLIAGLFTISRDVEATLLAIRNYTKCDLLLLRKGNVIFSKEICEESQQSLENIFEEEKQVLLNWLGNRNRENFDIVDIDFSAVSHRIYFNNSVYTLSALAKNKNININSSDMQNSISSLLLIGSLLKVA